MNICEILKDAETIAVVGISSKPNRTSRNIASYLLSAGYKVYGVNPNCTSKEVDGINVYNSLNEIPVKIDIVNVFRRSENIPELIEDILAVNPKVLWLQLGVRNDSAVEPLKNAGIITIQDKCIYVEHSGCY